MSTTQAPQESGTAPSFICEAGLIDAVVEGINAVSTIGECLFEFRDDGLRTACVDAANVQMIEQFTPAESFEHYDFTGDRIGLNTERIEDLIGVADNDSVFEFAFNPDTRKFDIRFEDVEYTLAGIDPEIVNGKLETMPDRSKYDYDVEVTLPVRKLERATDIVDMFGSIATFFMGSDGDGDPIFEVTSVGDTDASTVSVHEADDFEWEADPPTPVLECKQSNDYMKVVPGLLSDHETVPFVTGESLPYFIDTTRYDGAIETTLAQAPRIDSSK